MRETNYNSQIKETGVLKTSPTFQTETKFNNSKLGLKTKWLLSFVLLFVAFLSKAQVDVTSSGGTSTSATYTTLRDATNAINTAVHTGTITVSITGNTSEPGMDSIVSSGTVVGANPAASYTSILIKPTATATISGSTATGQGLLKLAGADNVTIDGSITLNGTTRDLTITNTATSGTVCGIWLASSSGNGATNNTIRNVNLTQNGAAITFAGISSANTTTITSAAPTPNSNNTYTNNYFHRSQYGLLLLGTSASPDVNVQVNNNSIDSINTSGLYLSAQSGFNVFNNYFDQKGTVGWNPGAHGFCIWILNGSLNGNVYNNNIFRVRYNGTSQQLRGIWFNSTSPSPNSSIHNNFIGDMWCPGISNSFSLYAVRIDAVNGGVRFRHNTVNLTTSLSNSSAVSVCLGIVGTTLANSMDVRNNIFRNVQDGGGNAYAFANLTTASVLGQCDNNAYWSHKANINVYTSGQIAASSLATIQGQTLKDANSVIVNASFVSNTDLHLQAVAGNALINNGGQSLSGAITTDFDGNTRSASAPDMGADEIVYTPRITSISSSTACPGASVTINGADLTGATAVSLAGLAATSFTVVNTGQITAVVPNSTTPSNSAVTVTTTFGTATSSSNLNRLSPATYISKSISTGSEGDQVTIAGTNFTNASGVTFNGTTSTFTITNSSEIVATVPTGATTGDILITDACGNSVNAGSFTVVPANPCTTPSAQATNFVASSISTTTLNGTFSFASGSPSGYLVVYSAVPLSGAPVDGTTYTPGAGFSGTIQQVSSSNTVSLSGLTGNTTYTVTIFAYNGGGCTGGPLYNTTSPLTYTFTTCSNVPTSITTSPASTVNNPVTFSWSAPAGGGANVVSYELEVAYDAAFTMPVSGSPFAISATSQVVSGFNFNTLLHYRVRSNNGCNSAWVTGTVTTGCGGGYLPFSQNFNATTTSALPTCWITNDANGDGITWTSSNIDSRVSGLSNPRALRYLANTTTTTVAANDWAFMPGVQLTGGVSYTLSFLQNALTNSGEGLRIFVGNVADPSIATNPNKIFDMAGLTNTAAALRSATFTPATSGTYYIGFHCNSPSNTNGGLFLFLDDISLDVTPPPPSAPSPVTTSSPTSSSITVNWSDVSGELGYYIYSSLNGTDWILRSTVGANVTSTVINNLKESTAYHFKVEGYNAAGIGAAATTSSSTSTLSCGGVYTTNSYIGTLFTGSGNNWNNTANWSLGRTPQACDDVQINGTLPITTTCFLYLQNPVAIHNLEINQTTNGTALQRLFFYTQEHSLDISGNVTMATNRTANTTVTGDITYLVSGPGVITIDGNVSLGETGNRSAALGSGGASLGPIYLKGNVTFGPQSFLNFGNLINFVFDGASNQTVTLNSSLTSANPATYGLGNVQIGLTNTPTVTFTDTMATNSQMARVVNDFTISNGSSVVIANGTSFNRSQSASGTFTMGNNSSLTLSGSTGGFQNSNFPDSFATYTFANSSNVIYNGSATQTIAHAPVYGNLTLNNANGATLNGNVTVNNVLSLTNGKIATGSNKLTLGLSGTISGANSSNYINGTFEKTIPASTTSQTFEIGDASNYTPVSVSFVGGSTNSGGRISASSISGTPAALGYTRSGLSQTDYLSRTYRLSNTGVTGFTSITPTINYVSGDLVGNTSNANYYIADSVYGGGWTLRNTTSNPTSTSSSATNVTLSAGNTLDLLAGELDPPPAPTVDEPNPTSACEGASYVITGSNFFGVTGVTIGSANCLFTVNSPNQITITIPTGIPSGVISVTNSNGTASTSGSLSTLDQPLTTVTNANQTICSGDAIATVVLGNSNNVAGTTYSWTRTGNNSAVSGSTSGTTDISGTLSSTSTIPETMTYTVTSTGGNGCAGTSATATVVVKASPGVVNVTPATSAVCENSVQQLVANYTAATGSQETNSGSINVTIPDGSGTNGVNGLGGVNTDLIMSNVPAGAVVTKVEVGVSVNHTYTGDIALNVKAPNGKILNLAFQSGGSGDNYVNTIFSSDADPNSQFLPQDSTPGGITGVYAPDAFSNVGTPAFPSNTSVFSDLFSQPNGTWKLIARDYFEGDFGTINNWFVKVYYTLQPTFTWSPIGGLYLDAGHNTAYSGGSQQTVYAYNAPGTYNYAANISFDGCTASSSSASVTVEPIANAMRTPASQTVCSGTPITDILLTSNDNTATLNWTRNNTSSVTGLPASGSGNISGTLVNATSAPVTVTFTITPNGSGSQACSGTPTTATVTVNPVPLASVSPLSQNTCSGSAINPLLFLTTNSVGGTTFAWTRDNVTEATGISASGTAFVSGALTNTSGNTTVTFSVTAVGPAPSFCAGTPATATVSVFNLPSVFSVSGSGNFCSPAVAGRMVTLSGSETGISYQLYKNGIAIGSPVAGTGSSIDFGLQDAGTYTVSTSNSTGCTLPMTGSAIITSTSSEAASISIATANTTVCSGSNVAFSSNISNGGSSPSYQWMINGNNISGANGSTYIAPANSLATNDVITCMLTSSNTCASPGSSTSNGLTMTVTPSPAVAPITLNSPNGTVVSNITACDYTTSTNVYCATPGGTWSSSNPSIATTTNGAGSRITGVSNGTATISYTLAPVNGCSSTSSVIVTVARQTPATITGASAVCATTTSTYTTTATGGVWGTRGLATINSFGVATASVTPGSTAITYTQTNANGCVGVGILPITINARPSVPNIAYASGSGNPQAGAPLGFFCTNRSFTLAGFPSGGTWSSTGVVTINPSSGAGLTSASGGPGTITYTVTNANGCSNSRTMNGITTVSCASRGSNANSALVSTSNNFKMYPNPAKGIVTLQVEKLVGEGQITITDVLGKQVFAKPLSMGANTLEISNLSKGLYLVSIITADGKQTQKLVKE